MKRARGLVPTRVVCELAEMAGSSQKAAEMSGVSEHDFDSFLLGFAPSREDSDAILSAWAKLRERGVVIEDERPPLSEALLSEEKD